MIRLGAKITAIRAGRILAFLATVLLALGVFGAPAAEAKYASIVIDGHSGQVLHASNADTRNYPASLTKMMTIYMLFEALDTGRLNKSSKLKVSRRAAGASPSKLGLRSGQTISVELAIRSLVIRSANDVAVVVAETLGGTETKFAGMMTAKAKQIGMTKTTFANASGLPNRKQLSTARDMAKLAQSLYFTFPHYYHYFDEKKFRYGKRTYYTHNRVAKNYRGADGLKTGYTRASGYNLATSVERNGRRLIGVVFGGRSARSRDAHMIKLLDKAWPKVQSVRIETPRPKPGNVIVATVPGQGTAPLSSDFLVKTVPAPESTTATTTATAEKKATRSGPAAPALPKARPAKVGVLYAEGVPIPKPNSGTNGEAVTLPPNSRTAPTTRTVVTNNVKDGDWAIQVGAYYDRVKASRAVDHATSKMPSLNDSAEEAIVLLKGRKRTIYRARMVWFSEKDARATCRALKKKRVPCIAVKQDKNARLASVE